MMGTVRSAKILTFAFLILLAVRAAAAEDSKWVSLFDGRTMNGWETVGQDSVWEVSNGAMTGSGKPSMLVCTRGPYKNFRYRAEVKISDGGNSGLYFRT